MHTNLSLSVCIAPHLHYKAAYDYHNTTDPSYEECHAYHICTARTYGMLTLLFFYVPLNQLTFMFRTPHPAAFAFPYYTRMLHGSSGILL